ncbi:hypothetical protein TeGR_g12382, partial [Tetraparma gracilis]
MRASEGVFAPTLSKSFESGLDLRRAPPDPSPEGKTLEIKIFAPILGAGVKIGDICTSVNGVAGSTAKQTASEVRKGSRPLALTFLRADIAMSLDEGFHMVKYDTTDAPYKYSGWKPKYVVGGGIIATPHMLMMYRSKEEYDIAVLEVTSQRRLSVKVKEFDLRSSHI